MGVSALAPHVPPLAFYPVVLWPPAPLPLGLGVPLALLWGGTVWGCASGCCLACSSGGLPVCSGGSCGYPSWLLGSSVVPVLLCPPRALRPGCFSIWGVPPGCVASVGLGEVPML
ncbi:hypothetical protein LDENG_00236760 [Lucifuga dentata]|nr:hypothetical protein LDENG_00236760 [Lucifuga dentata]